jgi:hypothetical protein
MGYKIFYTYQKSNRKYVQYWKSALNVYLAENLES